MQKKSALVTSMIIIIILIILSQISFTVLYTSPSKISITSEKVSENDNEIESIRLSENKKRNGKTGTYVNISDPSQISTLKEYARISTLHISNCDMSVINDIKGLEVHTLVLDNVKNTDFALFDTKSIYSVTLLNLTTTDFSPLKESNNLTSLSMSKVEFDIDSLSKIGGKLTELNMADMKLENTSFLKSTPRLEKLSIYNCDLARISHIDGLKDLRELTLSSNRISDISPLYNLKNLRFIMLDRNRIKGTADFSQMKNLTEIYAPFNNINEIIIHKDASPVSLNFSYNNIKSLSSEFIETISKTDCKVNIFGNMLTEQSETANNPNIIYRDETFKDFSYLEHKKYMDEIADFSSQYINPQWTDEKKCAVAFCVLSSKIRYFHNYKTSSKKEADYVHTGYGALINNLAVCDGISYVYRDILRYNSIDSYIYNGDINSQSDDTTHAWNIVYIESKPYHADLTTAINRENELSGFKYYDLGAYIEKILRSFGKSDIYMENNSYFLTDKNAPGCTENLSESTISGLIYDLSEGDEKSFFIDKNIFIEKGVIKNE